MKGVDAEELAFYKSKEDELQLQILERQLEELKEIEQFEVHFEISVSSNSKFKIHSFFLKIIQKEIHNKVYELPKEYTAPDVLLPLPVPQQPPIQNARAKKPLVTIPKKPLIAIIPTKKGETQSDANKRTKIEEKQGDVSSSTMTAKQNEPKAANGAIKPQNVKDNINANNPVKISPIKKDSTNPKPTTNNNNNTNNNNTYSNESEIALKKQKTSTTTSSTTKTEVVKLLDYYEEDEENKGEGEQQ